MKYGYYPGCSLHSTGVEYGLSFRAVCDRLGIELQELKGWICCGATPAHSTSRLLSLALPIKNLCLAERKGFSDVLAPCAACFSRFKTALHETARHPELRQQVEEVVAEPLPETVTVRHPLEILDDTVDLTSAVQVDLSGLEVVCYYGCELTRPPEVMQFDECEYPMSMDRLLRSVGVRTLDWSYKTDCCGGALALTETDLALSMMRDILDEAKAVGADAIVVACPLCQANLDMRQTEIEEKYGVEYDLPVLYFTQLLGLALGISPKRLGLHKHFVAADGLLREAQESLKEMADA